MAHNRKARSDQHQSSFKQQMTDDPIGSGLGAALGPTITTMVVQPTTAHVWATVVVAALALAYTVWRKAD